MNKQTAYTAVQSIFRAIGAAGSAVGSTVAETSPALGGTIVLASGSVAAIAELMDMNTIDDTLKKRLELPMKNAAKKVAQELGLDQNKLHMLTDIGARLEQKILRSEWNSLPDDVLACGYENMPH